MMSLDAIRGISGRYFAKFEDELFVEAPSSVFRNPRLSRRFADQRPCVADVALLGVGLSNRHSQC
jgi:hypothetical protein